MSSENFDEKAFKANIEEGQRAEDLGSSLGSDLRFCEAAYNSMLAFQSDLTVDRYPIWKDKTVFDVVAEHLTLVQIYDVENISNLFSQLSNYIPRIHLMAVDRAEEFFTKLKCYANSNKADSVDVLNSAIHGCLPLETIFEIEC